MHIFRHADCFPIISTFSIIDIAWSELYPCIQWMRPFAEAVHEQGLVEVRLFDKVLVVLCYE